MNLLQYANEITNKLLLKSKEIMDSYLILFPLPSVKDNIDFKFSFCIKMNNKLTIICK